MKPLPTFCLAAALALGMTVGAMAQTRARAAGHATITAPESAPETASTPAPTSAPSARVQAAPALPNGAIATGLSGFYDYQSNGGSPGYIVLDPTDPNVIHVTAMVASDGTDQTSMSNSRRVGYGYSSDGGNSWTTTAAIQDFKLGYPYLQLLPGEGIPIIAAHGDDNGNRVMFFAAAAPGDVSFFQLGEMPVVSNSGRSEVIWPTWVFDPTDPTRAVVAASYFTQTGEEPAPLQVGSFGVDGQGSAWGTVGDSLETSTSGGRYVMSSSSDGRIGLAWMGYNNYDSAYTYYGIYFAESSDGGGTWSAPQHVGTVHDDTRYNFNGDVDTLFPGANLDLSYDGTEPVVAFVANVSGFYRTEELHVWTPTTGDQEVQGVDSARGIGISVSSASAGQPNMPTIAYPTVATADDGQHIVVVFQAAAQYEADPNQTPIVSPDNFHYYRLWGIGSSDGGATWGDPFLVQDFSWGSNPNDSATIEYPAANENSMMVAGNMQLDLVYQAKRYPGMYAFVAGTNPAGPINEAYQYFQRISVTPDMFSRAPSSVALSTASAASLSAAPSIAADRTEISYSVAIPGAVTIRLYDAIGTKVREISAASPAVPGGTYRRSVDLHDLPAGSYRCVLTQNGGISSIPVTIVR